jgi:dihydropteroate synthase
MAKTYSWNIKGKLFEFDQPKVMGILNLTPDSFHVASRVAGTQALLEQAGKMLEAGADILDLGAMSSRPGATDISAETELERLLPPLEALLKAFPEVILSIDTDKASVAEQALAAGAHIINDISGGLNDPQMMATVAQYQVPYIIMHMQGRPKDMQLNPTYQHVTTEVLEQLARQVAQARAQGIKDVAVDPGFGFGKTLEHNYQLLREFRTFNILDLPILAGVSRKGMIWRPLGIEAAEALNGTTALHMALLERGANILRVHDVQAAMEVVKLYGLLR